MGDVLIAVALLAINAGCYFAGYDRGRRGVIAQAVLRLERDEMRSRESRCPGVPAKVNTAGRPPTPPIPCMDGRLRLGGFRDGGPCPTCRTTIEEG